MRFIFIATGLFNRCWLPCSPRGYHVSTVFRREQSNSPGGTRTRVEASFVGCCAVSMQSEVTLALTLTLIAIPKLITGGEERPRKAPGSRR